MRLFVAIDLPEAIKGELSKLCTGVPGARWVKHEQMHVTLRFIGEVEESTFVAIQTALAGIQAPSFGMRLKGVGQFPPKGVPRVIWAGLQVPGELRRLQEEVEKTITGLGFGEADHPFSAHMTLARLKTPPHRDTVRQYFARHEHFQTDEFPVEAFIMYSSVLGREGSTYRREGVYGLGG